MSWRYLTPHTSRYIPTGALMSNHAIKPGSRGLDSVWFRPVAVKEVIGQVLADQLGDKEYDAEEATNWSKAISDEIKIKLRDLGYDRYKFVVQVVIGEQRGEGVKMGCRCFWDSDTDNYAQDIYLNDSLFCVAAAYGVFFY